MGGLWVCMRRPQQLYGPRGMSVRARALRCLLSLSFSLVSHPRRSRLGIVWPCASPAAASSAVPPPASWLPPSAPHWQRLAPQRHFHLPLLVMRPRVSRLLTPARRAVSKGTLVSKGTRPRTKKAPPPRARLCSLHALFVACGAGACGRQGSTPRGGAPVARLRTARRAHDATPQLRPATTPGQVHSKGKRHEHGPKSREDHASHESHDSHEATSSPTHHPRSVLEAKSERAPPPSTMAHESHESHESPPSTMARAGMGRRLQAATTPLTPTTMAQLT
jgi:hypothetical protein